MARYTEADAQAYYNEQDELYRRCWAEDGTTHWGFFPDDEVDDLQEAGWRWTEQILDKSEITANSRVLEVGCGNGAVAIWLARQRGCSVIGLDISSLRIQNAREAARAHPELHVRFMCGSVTELPFETGEFTHVWGQGVLYHVPDLDKALSEVSRVLGDRGTLLIDDFVRPEVEIGEATRAHFYDRLKFDARYTHREYLDALRSRDLMPIEAMDMARHIDRTYQLVARAAESIDDGVAESFRVSGRAVRAREVVGYFYRCVKIEDRLQWVYDSQSSADIEHRYDAWATLYEGDLTTKYDSPVRAAEMLTKYVEDKGTTILDIGCGTGLVGQALANEGYTNIHGLDISRAMLDVAEHKKCYSKLLPLDLAADAEVDIGGYDAVITTGCITFGHAPGYTLARIFSWVNPGGLVHISVREDFLEQDAYFDTLLHGLRWDVLERERWVTGIGRQPTIGLVLRRHSG